MTNVDTLLNDPDTAGVWSVDPDRSTVNFKIKNLWGLLNVKGHFTSVSGDGQVTGKGAIFGRLDIQVASLRTGIGKRDEHLRSADFFDADRYPDISVVGDLAAAMSYRPGKEPTPVPGVSPGAKQMGRAAATNILRRIAGQPAEPFRYSDYGNLATIGRNSAVVDLGTPFGPLRFSGRMAWLFWLFAHVYFLIGFRNRFVVLMDWASAYWSFQRYARVVADVRARGES